MSSWTLMPENKKSIEEVTYFVKDDKVVVYRIGWRAGSVNVLTSDDNPPELELEENEEIDVLGIVDEEHVLSVDLDSFWDGCWNDWEIVAGEVSDEELDEMIAAYEEDYDDGLEALGWTNDDYEIMFYGPLLIEKVEEAE